MNLGLSLLVIVATAVVLVIGGGAFMMWLLAGPNKEVCRCGHFIARHAALDTSCNGVVGTGIKNAVGVEQKRLCLCTAFQQTERGRWNRALMGAELVEQ